MQPPQLVAGSGGACHLVVLVAAQDDLLGHLAEGAGEIHQLGRRVEQRIEDGGIEFGAFERGQRIGIESERPVDGAGMLAELLDDAEEKIGAGPADLEQVVAREAQRPDRGQRLHCRGARQVGEGAKLAEQRAAGAPGEMDGAVKSFDGDVDLAVEQQIGGVARRVLPDQYFGGCEEGWGAAVDERGERRLGQMREGRVRAQRFDERRGIAIGEKISHGRDRLLP
jgi:hypothetical protein